MMPDIQDMIDNAPYRIVTTFNDGQADHLYTSYDVKQAEAFFARAEQLGRCESVRWEKKGYTMTELAAQYGVPVERMVAQFKAQAASLQQMADKAKRTGKKVGGYTLIELNNMVAEELRRSEVL